MLKPVLYIIGTGSEGMNKLSLEIYRLLAGAEYIYFLSSDQAAVRDMIAEGLPCIDLDLGVKANKAEIPGGYSVLALAGQPIAEGRQIADLKSRLGDIFNVNTYFLIDNSSLERLAGIMTELRSENGCPWDREQTHETLKKYLIEEVYEVIDAIDSKDMNNLCEELGDLLLQIVFHSKIAEETNAFNLALVFRSISEKMIRRHPHVFGSVIAESSAEVLVNWDKIKREEKSQSEKATDHAGDIFGIPGGLPSLLMAEQTQKKASKVGFDWDSYQGPLAKVHEELAELEQVIGDDQKLEDELGDLLFSVVNLSRFLNLNAEECLRKGTKKFQRRFTQMNALIIREKKKMTELTLREMDFFWNLVKSEKKMG